MEKVVALILAGGRVDELLCLTERRPKSALPIFGIYRIIDLVLSNLMHAGINNVGVLSQYRPSALVRHIGTGEHWDFIGRQRGIRILPPYRGFKASDWYKGTADAVYQNVSYIEEFNPEHILVASADHIYRMDYKPLLQFHEQQNADATICFTKLKTKSTRFGYGVITRNGRLTRYLEKPDTPPSDWVSMTLYCFKTEFLIDVLKANALETSHEFGRDIIPRIVENKKIFALRFSGYWAYARTIDTYFHTNMDLLRGRIDVSQWQIRTNQSERCAFGDRMPARINGNVTNSVVSEGCIAQGSVKNSILSPGVVVKSGAEVVNSIIFHDTVIDKNAKLTKVICDKDSVIGEESIIGGFGEDVPSQEYPDLLNSGITLLGRNSNIPSQTKIGANTTVYASANIGSQYIEPGSTMR